MADSKTIRDFVQKSKKEKDNEGLGISGVGNESVLSDGFRELTSDNNLYYKAVIKKGLGFEISRGEVYSSLMDSEVMMSLINNIRRNTMSVDGRGRDDIIKMATSHDFAEDGLEDSATNALVGAISRGLGK